MLTCPNCGVQNPDGARFCNACASPLQADERALGEERKVVTVLFADLVGFTARAERLDPEDVRGVLSPVPRARCARSSSGAAARSRSSSATR